MITVNRNMRFGQVRIEKAQTGSVRTETRVGVPRVARLMALAIRFSQLVNDGVVVNQADLARLGQVTRARLTQIMNLLMLAPDLQEEILFLRTQNGAETITEKELRPIAALANWRRQRKEWARLQSSKKGDG